MSLYVKISILCYISSENTQGLEVTDLETGLIRLGCNSGRIAFNSVIGTFGKYSLVLPIKVGEIDQLMVVVSDPSTFTLIALQTEFTVRTIF